MKAVIAGPQIMELLSEHAVIRANTEFSAPSFRNMMDKKLRKLHLLKDIQLSSHSFSRLLRDKIFIHHLAKELSIKTPRLIAKNISLEDIAPFIEGLESFVIKPCTGKNAWGVSVNRRMDSGFYDLMSQKSRSWADLLAHQRGMQEKHALSDRWIVEEAVLGKDTLIQVDDFKFYSCLGEVVVILQKSYTGAEPRYKWYDRAWNAIHTGKYADKTDPALQPPANASVLLANVQNLSRLLPIPFCRIDMYSTGMDVFLGELTPEPGLYHNFSEDYDQLLGAAMEAAETQLLLPENGADHQRVIQIAQNYLYKKKGRHAHLIII